MSALQQTFTLLLVGGLFLLVYLLQPILTPFLVGMIFAYLGDPLVDRLQRWRVGRTLSVAIVFLLFSAVIALAVFVLMPLLVNEISSLVRNIPVFIRWLQETTSPFLIENFGVDPFDVKVEGLRERLSQNWQEAGGLASAILGEVTRSGMALATTVMNLALIPVVAFYLMRDWDEIVERCASLIPRNAYDTVTGLVRECDEVLSAFLRGQLLIMFLLGCIYSLGLHFIGLELALVIGMMAGLASIVPYLGFVVGITAAIVAALFQFQDVIHLVYVVLVFGAGQMLEGMVLTPLLVGDRIGLHPVAVIFAVLAGGQLFGFVGVLLALPVAAIIMVFLRHAHERYVDSEYYKTEAEGQ